MRSLTRFMALAILLLAIPAASFAGIFVSITVAPPPLPVYVQPVCPQPGYMWTPGFWSWGDDGYYWVPGTWVAAPTVGMLWTPGYWGWSGGYYRWNGGYWGPHIGFYGGVNYGYGYGGMGFVGGEWRGGGFFYNSAVMNVGGAHITNVYVNKTVIVNNTTVNNVSYNGGTGGVRSTPTPAEQAVSRERHIEPTREQTQHETAAARNPQLLAKNNGGRPAIAATTKAGDFSARNAVPAKSAGGRVEPASLSASARTMPSSARTAPSALRPAANTARPAPAATTPHNIARPPSNTYNKPPASTTHSQQSMTRPPAGPANHESRPITPTHNAAPHTAAPQEHAQKAPPEHAQKNAPNEHEKR